MAKYTDIEKLKAEIKGKIAEVESEPAPADRETTLLQMCKINAFREALSVIKRIEKTSLQQEQPEVDLEKDDIINYMHEHFYYDKDFDGYGHSKFRPVFTREDIETIARHFYELGLKAKEESK